LISAIFSKYISVDIKYELIGVERKGIREDTKRGGRGRERRKLQKF
jgi:hypothetical protein